MPVLLAAAAALFAGERLDWFGWLALCGSTVGAALIVLGGSHGSAAHGEPSLVGDLMVVASLVTALAWILLSKKLMETHSAQVVTAYTIVSGTIMLVVWVLGPWLLSPLTHRNVAPPPFAHVSLTAWVALAISACSAPQPPRCSGTGASTMCPLRAPAFFSISSRLWAPGWASSCSASTSAPMPGSAAD